MKNIWIAGASGFGREVYQWILDAADAGNFDFQLRIRGFLDSGSVAADPEKVFERMNIGDTRLEIKILEDFYPDSGDLVACGFGEPKTKARLMPVLIDRGAELLTVVHPTSVLANSARIGPGSVLAPFATVSVNVTAGICCLIDGGGAVAGHDSAIGDYCTMSPGAHLLGYARMGDRVWLANHASVLPRAVVEDDVKVGVGSVVIKRARTHGTYFGNPAVRIGEY